MDQLGVRPQRLGPADFAELCKRVRAAGGTIDDVPCVSDETTVPAVFAETDTYDQLEQILVSPEVDAYAARQKRAPYTPPSSQIVDPTFCGRQRMMQLPYLTRNAAGSEVMRKAVVCADDDLVAYWPKFYGRRDP